MKVNPYYTRKEALVVLNILSFFATFNFETVP